VLFLAAVNKDLSVERIPSALQQLEIESGKKGVSDHLFGIEDGVSAFQRYALIEK
jgi:hypothetical protein